MSAFHPELSRAKYLPSIPLGPLTTKVLQRLGPRTGRPPSDLRIDAVAGPGPEGAPPVTLRIYRPRALEGLAPVLFWVHGGGYVFGSPEVDEQGSIDFARDLGITVVSVKYRLAPGHPAPAALEDAYAGLRWVFAHGAARGMDPDRIAIGGASAGGGIAAALASAALDRGEVAPVFQLLVEPMLDDRTVLRTDVDTKHLRMWSVANNRFGWASYLGAAPGSPDVSPYAAPARREQLDGLPPAWIGVGTLDLFHDEDVAYAKRLTAAGVPCELSVVEGAFHGFEYVFRKAGVVRQFRQEQHDALRRALFPH